MTSELDGYYQDRNSRLNTVIGNDSQIWRKIVAARDDYHSQYGTQSSPEYFNLWLINEWGIELKFEAGMVSLNSQIVDEQKYILFLLKY